MIKYAEALEIANRAKPARPTELVSNAGGRARYTTFRIDGEDVVARLFRTDIVRWHTDGTVTLNSGGYRTATTKEAMCSLIGQCSVFSEKKVWKVIDPGKGVVDFHDGIRIPVDRLEYLRGEIRAERISMSEIAELQGLANRIDPSDVELLEWAGVPES